MKKEEPKKSHKKTVEKKNRQKSPQKQQDTRKGKLVEPSENGDEIQLQRREVYVEPLTRQVLRNLIEDGDEAEIIPFYHPASGFTYGTKSTQEENGRTRFSIEFLENLVKLDILQKEFYDSISTCPKCKSPIITLHHRCPKCNSHNIDKTSLTEHIPCGNIDQKGKYKQDICPKCCKKLIEGEYRNMGCWYVCKKCSERFEHPQFDVICRECNNSFMIEDAIVLEVPKFVLNTKRKKEIRQNVASLESIGKVLTELGFKIEMPGWVTGQKSGMRYHFSILAKKYTNAHETVVAVDHGVAEDEIQTSPLILYIYKISELKVDLPIFIALPKLSETARKIAMGHDILIIEGQPEGEEQIASIKAEIQNRIAPKIIPPPEPKASPTPIIDIEEPPQVLATPTKSVETKPKGKPLSGMLGKLKRNSKKKEQHLSSEVAPEEAQMRNIVFLLDGSSSMRKGIGDMSNFELASKAIENVLTNPDPKAENDMLSVAIFWSEFITGFKKEILYENMPMNMQIDPEKLNQFGKPRKYVGSPLWEAVEYSIEFLKEKKGSKIVKLITDAEDIPPLKDETTISKLENNQIHLDCIVVGSEGNTTLGKLVNNYKMGRFFESINIESISLALKA